MTSTNLLLLLLGFVALVEGANLLVRGASRLASAVGISPLVIGLTVVAFGTSAPELAVSVRAGLTGNPGLALGNVVGSNIFNTLFILGLSALIVPLVVAKQLVRIDVPFMILVSLLVLIAGSKGGISRLEGGLFVAGLIGYLAILLVTGRKEGVLEERRGKTPPQKAGPGALLLAALSIAAGLLLLVLGSRWLVGSASTLARDLGVSELMIGLTIVAVGTSLPEVATSVVAGLRGERDIAVGNAVGSNIFNILGVLGAASLLAPRGMPIDSSALNFDIPVMIAAAVVCLPILFRYGRINRLQGGILLGYYLAYACYTILAHTGATDMLHLFRQAMIWFVLPLSILGILFSLFTGVAERPRPEEADA